MRIAMMTNNYKPVIGGVPISVERLSQGLRELGHEVYIFAPEYSAKSEDDNYVIRYKSFSKKLKNELTIPNSFDKQIDKEFGRLSFDCIHVHHPILIGNTALRMSKKYNIPVVFTYHTRYEEYLHYFNPVSKKRHFKISNRFLLKCGRDILLPKYLTSFTNRCDLVFAPTKMISDHLADRGTSSSIAILPTGLDENAYINDRERSACIREQYLKGRKFLFCTVSRLEKEKNFEFLLRGIKKLRDLAGDVFRLVIVGEGTHGEYLKQYARNLGIQSNVSFVGSVPNDQIKDYQFASDLFLFSSKTETQGIVLLEALAAANPIIAIKASGVIDLVENEFNGFMTDESEDAWTDKIFELMNNPELYLTLKKGAQITASRYRASYIAIQAQACYENLLSERRKKWMDAYLNYKESDLSDSGADALSL